VTTFSIVALLVELALDTAGQLVTDGPRPRTVRVLRALRGRVREGIEVGRRAVTGHEGGDAGGEKSEGESEEFGFQAVPPGK
jgi:hypothetical protein